MNNERSIDSQIRAAERELASLNKRKTQLEYEIKHLKNLRHTIAEKTPYFNQKTKAGITNFAVFAAEPYLFQPGKSDGQPLEVFWQEQVLPDCRDNPVVLSGRRIVESETTSPVGAPVPERWLDSRGGRIIW